MFAPNHVAKVTNIRPHCVPTLERSEIAIARNIDSVDRHTARHSHRTHSRSSILKSEGKQEMSRYDQSNASIAQSDSTQLFDDIASKNIEIGTLKEQVYNLKNQLVQQVCLKNIQLLIFIRAYHRICYNHL